MKKIILPGIVAGVAMLFVGFLLNFVFSWLFPHFQAIYVNPTIFIQMDSPQAILFFLYPIPLGIALAWLYKKLKFSSKKPLKSSLKFANLYFFVSALPGFFINIGSFNLPIMMILTWTVMSYVNALTAGLLFSKMLT